MKEKQIEDHLINKLSHDLKYVYREDIYDRDTLERNFREKFERLNRVHHCNPRRFVIAINRTRLIIRPVS